MNFYFVFEGKTEPIVYKKWLSVLLSQLTEVESYDSVNQNNYYYESDIAVFSRMRGNKILERLTVQDSNTPHSCDYRYMGVPSCYRVCANAIQEINEVPKYDYSGIQSYEG